MRSIHTELKWRRKQKFSFLSFLPPANEVCEGYVFTGVCLSTWGGMRGCSQGGACMVVPEGCVWLLPRGVHGFLGGHAWFFGGAACMVFWGGQHAWFFGGWHAWFFGGVRGFFGGWGGWGACMVFWGACMVSRGGVHGFFDEIWSMSGRYASYWNAFLFLLSFSLLPPLLFDVNRPHRAKAKAKLFFDVCCLFFDHFRFRSRFYLVCVIRPLLTSDMFRRLCGQCFSEPEQPSRGVVWRSPDLAMTRR